MHHVEKVFFIDAAMLLQCLKIPSRKLFKMGNQSCHCRVEPISLAQLNLEAFSETSRKNSRWIKLLQGSENPFHNSLMDIQALGQLQKVCPKIASVFQIGGKLASDQPLLWCERSEGDLTSDMVVQCFGEGGILVEGRAIAGRVVGRVAK
ncbi:hypothetical protein X734_30480 [Mesorhizobium sp. L2C084A000]|nr:hypothetical protein X738_28380 [Mesorhizobium sp. LNHC209A00]ESZ21356.1 hypothetical protein X734_30480 [Mesorhizobium sp. L2C084A000]